MINWYDIDPKDAVDIDLTERLDIKAPLNENGERCPWPWEPQQLLGVPMGQYHCKYCGAMVVAGMRHPDYGAYDWADDPDLSAKDTMRKFDELPDFNCGPRPGELDRD